MIELEIDGQSVRVFEGETILGACRRLGIDTPTLCYGDTLEPANACRVCVVEVEGVARARARLLAQGRGRDEGADRLRARAPLAQARARAARLVGRPLDDGRRARTTSSATTRSRSGSGRRRRRIPERDRKRTGHHVEPDGQTAATVHAPIKIDNELYVRDYSKCILCYKCVDACGEQYQNTFAIHVAGRGFDARISTEYVAELPESACVYCGNCIAVCPTGALMFRSEHELREEGDWREDEQTVTTTVCPYCGVGCNLELHVQDNTIVKVTSPDDHDVTRGNLCIKGRFGFQHVQARDDRPEMQGGRGRPRGRPLEPDGAAEGAARLARADGGRARGRRRARGCRRRAGLRRAGAGAGAAAARRDRRRRPGRLRRAARRAARGLVGARRAGCEVAFACGVDTPLLVPGIRPRRRRARCATATTPSCPVIGGRAQPLLAAYRVAIAPRLRALLDDGAGGLRDIPRRLRGARAGASGSCLATPSSLPPTRGCARGEREHAGGVGCAARPQSAPGRCRALTARADPGCRGRLQPGARLDRPDLHLAALDEHDVAAVEHDREPPVRSDRARRPGPVADADPTAAKGVAPLELVREHREAVREPVVVAALELVEHRREHGAPVERATRGDPQRRRRQPRLAAAGRPSSWLTLIPIPQTTTPAGRLEQDPRHLAPRRRARRSATSPCARRPVSRLDRGGDGEPGDERELRQRRPAGGRSSTEKRSAVDGASSQRRPERPRPAVWCSATATAPCGWSPSRSTSCVEVVSGA